jgi:hypothetical protein
MRLKIDTSFGNLEKPPVLLRVTKNAQQNRRQNPGERREGIPLVNFLKDLDIVHHIEAVAVSIKGRKPGISCKCLSLGAIWRKKPLNVRPNPRMLQTI